MTNKELIEELIFELSKDLYERSEVVTVTLFALQDTASCLALPGRLRR